MEEESQKQSDVKPSLPSSRSRYVLQLNQADKEIGPDQLVQSHTPLKDYVGDLAEKPVLILGGIGEAGRRIAKS